MAGIMMGRIVRNAAPAVKPRIPLSLPLPWERAGVRENSPRVARIGTEQGYFLLSFLSVFFVSPW
jgi:hypothetical protein